jgi:hypothetical protein
MIPHMKSTDLTNHQLLMNVNSHFVLADEKLIHSYLLSRGVDEFINLKELQLSAYYLIDKTTLPHPKNSAITNNLIKRGVSPEFQIQN